MIPTRHPMPGTCYAQQPEGPFGQAGIACGLKRKHRGPHSWEGMPPGLDTWDCHICGEERWDADIAVYSLENTTDGGIEIKVNVRHCRDREDCVRGAIEKAGKWMARWRGSPRAEGRFQGKTDAEVEEILEGRLGATHRRENELRNG